MTTDSSAPWNYNVRGGEVPRLINTDAEILRTEAGLGTGKTSACLNEQIGTLDSHW